jgi:hypothetical protein
MIVGNPMNHESQFSNDCAPNQIIEEVRHRALPESKRVLQRRVCAQRTSSG